MPRKPTKNNKPEVSRVVIRINHGLNMALWKSRPSYVDWAREFLKGDMGQELVSVLRNEQPFVIPTKLDGTMAAYELGRVRGYMECISNVSELASDQIKSPKTIPVDYGADEALAHLGIEPEED